MGPWFSGSAHIADSRMTRRQCLLALRAHVAAGMAGGNWPAPAPKVERFEKCDEGRLLLLNQIGVAGHFDKTRPCRRDAE